MLCCRFGAARGCRVRRLLTDVKERMMTSTRLLGLLVGGALTFAGSSASAQGPAPLEFGYGHLNLGLQASPHDLDQDTTATIYDEPARIQVSDEFGTGAVFDVGGGVRVWRRLYAGLSYSRLSNTRDATVNASIPHPQVFDQPRAVTATAGLKHTEDQVHLHAMWRMPITTKFDVTVGIGPTFYSVRQDLVEITEANISETGNPSTGVTINSVNVVRATDSTVGWNLSADGTYLLTRRYGVGGFLRFTGGSVDMNVGSETVGLDVGGFQIGIGGRVRF
jgi:hypothetical protein